MQGQKESKWPGRRGWKLGCLFSHFSGELNSFKAKVTPLPLSFITTSLSCYIIPTVPLLPSVPRRAAFCQKCPNPVNLNNVNLGTAHHHAVLAMKTITNLQTRGGECHWPVMLAGKLPIAYYSPTSTKSFVKNEENSGKFFCATST
jgi:hypothetical protein